MSPPPSLVVLLLADAGGGDSGSVATEGLVDLNQSETALNSEVNVYT